MFFREQIFVKAFFALSAQMSLPRMPQINTDYYHSFQKIITVGIARSVSCVLWEETAG
jgi:hypothetical protein